MKEKKSHHSSRVLLLTNEQRAHLLRLTRNALTPNGLAQRCRLVLRVADGEPLASACQHVGISRHHAYKWLTRYKQENGVQGLQDRRKGNSGRKKWAGSTNSK